MSNKIRVLICDDHALFREGVKATLMYKNDVVVVGEAVDGLDLLNKLNYIETDVILLDINMPRMDGLAVLPVLKENEKYKDIKVIILSMQNQMSMVSQMLVMGANAYLTKNVDSETIHEAIVTCNLKGNYFNDLTNQALLSTIKKNKLAIIDDDKQNNTEEPKMKSEELKNNDNSNVRTFGGIIFRGVMMGVIALSIILVLVYLYKTLSNNLNLLNFTP